MASTKAKSVRDRHEADLVLDVAVAHWASNCAENLEDRRTAHECFKEAVRVLYEFTTTEDLHTTPANTAEPGFRMGRRIRPTDFCVG
jgi:hypothetical protein